MLLAARVGIDVARVEVRPVDKRDVLLAFGTPSAASLLIGAQSSKVITLPSLSDHFSPPKLFSFRAPPTHGAHFEFETAVNRCKSRSRASVTHQP